MVYLKKYYKHYILVIFIIIGIILFSYYFSIDWVNLLKDWQNLIAILGSVLTAICVNYWQNFKNKQIKKEEKQDFENAVVSAIYEELMGLYNCYNNNFQEALLDVKDNQYMTTTFTITEDFFTIFHNNASNIGKIQNVEVRTAIVHTYIFLKRFVENLKFYNDYYRIFTDRRREIMGFYLNSPNLFEGIYFKDADMISAFSELTKIALPQDNYTGAINILKNSDYFMGIPLHNRILILNDNYSREYLVMQTNELQKDYIKIRNKIIVLITMMKDKYKITSGSIMNNNEIKCFHKNFKKSDIKEQIKN